VRVQVDRLGHAGTVTEIPQEWVDSGAGAIEYNTGFAGENPDELARAVIEDVLPDIRHAIAEDLRAEARRMREAARERPDREHWADAYEAAAHRIDDVRYPWRQS
jgi:hypothetical protein